MYTNKKLQEKQQKKKKKKKKKNAHTYTIVLQTVTEA